jgi:hypothetical protein
MVFVFLPLGFGCGAGFLRGLLFVFAFLCVLAGLLAAHGFGWLVALAFPCFAFGLLALPLRGAAHGFGCLAVLAFPCILIGLLASPLCGAAPTFLCLPQRKVGKRKRLTPLAFRCPPLAVTGSGPKTRSSLAQLASVTKHSSAPASRFAPRRTA